MMSGFQAKLAAAILVVFLVVNTSALLLNGCEKSLSCHGIISRKTFPGKEGSLGSENVGFPWTKKVGFRELRAIIRQSPPPPAIGRRSAFNSRAPPPQIL
ncbi:hypothetical protein Patl1_18111 [Pistacia atlantica]|uniref:Uncharacterized protein n=1 Tax=Pistacia atlantica TaxID=434234 RepID=A0ACC1BXN5_9ROSI|nr:hypothetical protein Patl1_18111 [Pistacia atlantica]